MKTIKMLLLLLFLAQIKQFVQVCYCFCTPYRLLFVQKAISSESLEQTVYHTSLSPSSPPPPLSHPSHTNLDPCVATWRPRRSQAESTAVITTMKSIHQLYRTSLYSQWYCLSNKVNSIDFTVSLSMRRTGPSYEST